MWFATGIVMHFVPFPALTEAERTTGLQAVDPARLRHGPADAVKASGIADATRVRLLARADGLVYVVQGESGVGAVHAIYAADLLPAGLRSADQALAIAVDHARRRGMDASLARSAGLASHDQWTVPNELDRHRPLYRVALNDRAGSELYVSSASGEVVRDTTRHERGWNFAGSVLHWIYPTVLRHDWHAWDTTVWIVSLAALLTAISGTVIGLLRLKPVRRRLVSPYRGWHAWHHWLGLVCACFVLSWIFSGWLSMDHGRLFSTGEPAAEELVLPSLLEAGPRAWGNGAARGTPAAGERILEIEWFVFGGQVYRRERLNRMDHAVQRLIRVGDDAEPVRAFLQASEVSAKAGLLSPHCADTAVIMVPDTDNYPVSSVIAGGAVYRAICGAIWLHFDGATGTMLERLDASRRTYRWLYSALHTLDFPALVVRPALRTVLIVLLCGLGLAFSLTGTVIGWRRLQREFPSRTSGA
jgi:hypothetical protein